MRYIDAIDRFMRSDRCDCFSTAHFFRVIADRLGIPELQHHTLKDGIA